MKQEIDAIVINEDKMVNTDTRKDIMLEWIPMLGLLPTLLVCVYMFLNEKEIFMQNFYIILIIGIIYFLFLCSAIKNTIKIKASRKHYNRD